MTAPTSFRYLEADGVATITFDRPDRLNALTFEVYGELRDLLFALRTRDPVKAVIITGEGRGFCSGAPLSADGATAGTLYAGADLVRALLGCRTPVVGVCQPGSVS